MVVWMERVDTKKTYMYWRAECVVVPGQLDNIKH